MISNQDNKLVATSKILRDKVATYGIVSNGLPTAVWTHSEEFRRGFVDSLVSNHGSVYKTPNSYYIELASDAPSILSDISDLLNMYGIINTTNGEKVRIDANTFAKVFKLSNSELQKPLSGLDTTQVSSVSTVKIVSIEKTDKKEKMYQVVVYDAAPSFKTALGFTGF